MTVKGELFREIAEAIIIAHGFGSNKMIARFDFYDMTSIDFNNWDVIDAYNFLVDNEYIREYTPGYMAKSHKAYNYGQLEFKEGRNGKFIGLTSKGWKIAPKYLNA